MFGPSTINRINGCEVDRSMNAMSMCASLHPLFGLFEIVFQKVESSFQDLQGRIPFLKSDFAPPRGEIWVM